MRWRSSPGLEHDTPGRGSFVQRRSKSRAASAKLIYIGGYGRSGSTLLEYLLTAHPEVVACGEIERHLRVFTRRRACTCGESVRHCQVWGEFQHKSGRLEGLDHTQLSLQVLDHISRQYAVMVDSSKTAWGSTLMPSAYRRNSVRIFFSSISCATPERSPGPRYG